MTNIADVELKYDTVIVSSEKLKIYEPICNKKGAFWGFWSFPYESDCGTKGNWETCLRKPPTYPGKMMFGGVVIIAIATDPKTNQKMVLVEKIYRMPIQKYIYEFPAGMRDPDETDPVISGLRELKEETGYTGKNGREMYIAKTDPWKSNGTHAHVICEVDLSDPENQNPKTDLEFEEDITPIWVPLKNLQQNLEQMAEENDVDIDQRLYAWSMGIGFAAKMA